MTLPSTDPLEENLRQAATLLRPAERVAVLTGAGISAESGVPTFRGGDGLWEGHRIEDVATPAGFKNNPGLVWRFYNQRRANLATVQPNPGHHALADMERRWRERFTLITQNVDGLHRAAGNKRVLELHGSLRRIRCTSCPVLEDRGLETLPDLPHCDACGLLLRPDIVWFHESLPEDVWAAADQAVKDCQCFLTVGTSAVVWPAAGLILEAKEAGAAVIEINPVPTDASYLAHVCLRGPSGEILPRLLAAL